METLKRKRSLDEMEATALKRKRTLDEIEDIILHKINVLETLKSDSRVVFASPDLFPPGFFEELYEDLRDNVVGVSALGDFQKPFDVFLKLINVPVAVMALMDHLKGLSSLNGREIEMGSIFGAFLHVSGLPDHRDFASLPDVGLAHVETRMDELRCNLADVLNNLLKMNKGIHRENILQFLALFINRNASRSRIQADPLSCASSGTFVNLSAIMLRLFEPFLDDPTKRNGIDPRYVFSGRLKLRGLTPIHATSDQVSGWSQSGNKFHFICECFFMTARVLNLGLMRLVSDTIRLAETRLKSENTLKAMRDEHPSPSPLVQQEIARMEKSVELYSKESSCYEAQALQEKWLIQRALSFYRVMVVWMVDLAGGFKIPTKATCPKNFAAIPEHFVDDAMELLILTSRFEAWDIETELADFMNFIIMFMASPEFIQNPYVRTKMVKVLFYWTQMINKSGNELFKGHQPALDYLVGNLLQVYAKSESTGSHSQFMDKLNARHTIKKVLMYLWEIPGHRNAWKIIAKEEEKGLYLQFLNILMNDSIHLLDEVLNNIMQLSSRTENVTEDDIKVYTEFANEYLEMIGFTTEEIVAPFLIPEMVERVASTLNYFLARLVTMFQLKSPTLKDPEKYEFWPREVLMKIVKIYVNLAKGDEENVFATAIIKDGRSYSEQLFGDAAQELQKNGEEKMINEFMELGRKAKVLTKQAEEVELALGEMPEEFMDPIMSTLMTDPVIIPNTNVRIDRPVILRHLLNKNTDPFSGLPLTPDMLIPDTMLKVKIDHFLHNVQSFN